MSPIAMLELKTPALTLGGALMFVMIFTLIVIYEIRSAKSKDEQ
jgi:hypothetical protein